jgi:hypothetical protein
MHPNASVVFDSSVRIPLEHVPALLFGGFTWMFTYGDSFPSIAKIESGVPGFVFPSPMGGVARPPNIDVARRALLALAHRQTLSDVKVEFCHLRTAKELALNLEKTCQCLLCDVRTMLEPLSVQCDSFGAGARQRTLRTAQGRRADIVSTMAKRKDGEVAGILVIILTESPTSTCAMAEKAMNSE